MNRSRDYGHRFPSDVAIVGGCGHAGLPLGIALASRNLKVILHDIDRSAVEQVSAGIMPFSDEGAETMLPKVINEGLLSATCDGSSIKRAEHVILVIGTPVDEHLNPDPRAVTKVVEGLVENLSDGQLLIMRSTVLPGMTEAIDKRLKVLGKTVDVAFCPERTAEGRALQELFHLPQIVGAKTDRAAGRAEGLFQVLTEKTVRLSPEEAELAKLFTNSWRYIKFATANQLYMIANDFGLDFERIRRGIVEDYPRAADMPAAGFAAGPCLFKDTAQLAAFNNNNFMLGHVAMMVNEGLPLYLVSRMEQRYDLSQMTVGILGMAFKGESDDIRSSLSYKLKKLLSFKAAGVVCADPYVTVDHDLIPVDEVVEMSDILVIGAPHKAFETLTAPVPIVDVWNLTGNGVRV